VKRSQRECITAQTAVDGHIFDETRLTGLRSCHTIATREPIAVKEFSGISPQSTFFTNGKIELQELQGLTRNSIAGAELFYLRHAVLFP